MSKERELILDLYDHLNHSDVDCRFDVSDIIKKVDEYLSQPEADQVPVAWITEWVQRYRHKDTPIMDRAVSFTKGASPFVPNPNFIPLYLAPQKPDIMTKPPLPVAWRYYYDINKSYTIFQQYPQGIIDRGCVVEPLYAEPQNPNQEFSIDKIKLEWYEKGFKQGASDISSAIPPKPERMTDDEIKAAIADHDPTPGGAWMFMLGIRWYEKHKV